jgi:hypothetical protein
MTGLWTRPQGPLAAVSSHQRLRQALSRGCVACKPQADYFFVPVRVRLSYDSERVMQVRRAPARAQPWPRMVPHAMHNRGASCR